MEQQKPSVGRMVHFHEEGGPYPAIITALNDSGSVELATFGKNSLYFQHSVYEWAAPDGPMKGRWSWPPRV